MLAEKQTFEIAVAEKMELMKSEMQNKESEKEKLQSKIQKLYDHFAGVVDSNQQADLSQVFEDIMNEQ